LLAVIDDDYYAIQCKFRQDQLVTITWTDVSTFYGSVEVHAKIKGGFLVTNTYDLVEEAHIHGEFIENLPELFFDCIRNNQSKISYPIKMPLAHQKQCLFRADVYYYDHYRAHIEAARGFG